MNLRGQIAKYKMFSLVLLTWITFAFFVASLDLIMKPFSMAGVESPIWSVYSCSVETSIEDFKSEVFYLFPATFAVLAIQTFVIFMSFSTIKNRKIWDDISTYNVTMARYIFASVGFVGLVALAYWVFLGFKISTFSPLLEPIDYRSMNDVFCTIEIAKALLEVMAVVTIVLLFCAVYSLVPTLVWDNKLNEVPHAREQLSYLIRWLRCYFDITIVYFLVGGAFQLAYVNWLTSHLIQSERNQSIEIGVVFFNSVFYVFLLVMVFVPSSIRIQRAILSVEMHETQEMTAKQRDQWRVENGFPNFGFSNSIKYIAALFSPLVFPVLSLVLGNVEGG